MWGISGQRIRENESKISLLLHKCIFRFSCFTCQLLLVEFSFCKF